MIRNLTTDQWIDETCEHRKVLLATVCSDWFPAAVVLRRGRLAITLGIGLNASLSVPLSARFLFVWRRRQTKNRRPPTSPGCPFVVPVGGVCSVVPFWGVARARTLFLSLRAVRHQLIGSPFEANRCLSACCDDDSGGWPQW